MVLVGGLVFLRAHALLRSLGSLLLSSLDVRAASGGEPEQSGPLKATVGSHHWPFPLAAADRDWQVEEGPLHLCMHPVGRGELSQEVQAGPGSQVLRTEGRAQGHGLCRCL